MEERKPKVRKRTWSVIIDIGAGDYTRRYCYTNVTSYYTEKRKILYIMEGKKIHRHDIKRIIGVQIREHKRSGIQ
jgi:hypothetical protein